MLKHIDKINYKEEIHEYGFKINFFNNFSRNQN